MWARNRAKLKRGDKCSWRGIPFLIGVTMILVSMFTTTLMPPIILEMLLRPRPTKLIAAPSIHLHSIQATMRGEEKERRE